MSTQEKIKQIVAEQLSIAAEEISELDDLQDDLFADSIDMVEIAFAIEREFSVDTENSVNKAKKMPK